MSLRPRYSLLNLFLLTALVAGGVKLWYGPHHVVERTTPTVEEEYTFTRDWSGSKNIHGVKITRSDLDSGTKLRIDVTYIRQGENTHRNNFIFIDATLKKYLVGLWIRLGGQTELAAQERSELDRAMQDEGERLRRQGFIESEVGTEFDWFLGTSN